MTGDTSAAAGPGMDPAPPERLGGRGAEGQARGAGRALAPAAGRWSKSAPRRQRSARPRTAARGAGLAAPASGGGAGFRERRPAFPSPGRGVASAEAPSVAGGVRGRGVGGAPPGPGLCVARAARRCGSDVTPAGIGCVLPRTLAVVYVIPSSPDRRYQKVAIKDLFILLIKPLISQNVCQRQPQRVRPVLSLQDAPSDCQDPTKYFGCELGAQTQFDVKNDRYIVNGSHEANKLQDMLDGFIKKFVLCPECENPETDLHVNPKKQTIGNSCKACGYRGMLDTHHKLCTFILKNPPENSDSATGKKEKEKKNRKGKDKENGSVSSSETPPPPPPNEISPPPHAVEEEEDDDWGEDTTEEAQRRRMDEISDHAKVLTLSDDLERTVEERVNILFDFVKKKKEEGVIDSSDKEIVAEAERLDVKAMGPLVLTEVLFNEKIREQIKKYRRHFLRFCHNNKKAQRYLLHGLECVVAMHQAQLISKIPHILKEMYDADLLEEEVIISWSEKASKKYVSKELAKEIRVKAEPFIKWLKEAEEESSGGEEDDEDENIEVNSGENRALMMVFC
uniref:Eukaryotic translation initiation factor 5 n=1 Tax=Oryctolagus cuniculus TaxID=9986 RepID=A0A5F9DL34_RABIT